MQRYFISFILLLIMGCDPNRVYEENKDISDAIWRLDDIHSFNFNIEDSNLTYGLHFNIRSTLSYPFQNIYVQYNLKDSTNNILKSELKEFSIFDLKTGEPLGDGLGDLFDNRFPIIDAQKFDYPGRYSVDFQQFMRLDSLPMIVSVGLRVDKNIE